MVFIPLINLNASAGNGCLIPELGMTKDFKSWLTNITVTNPANLLVFTVVGDSMVGEINDGDMVVINKTMTELQNNGTYVVCIDNQLYVKVLQRIPGNKVQVISKNAP
jgi:phage repressor protein C with HTH and peptisase S24 domain